MKAYCVAVGASLLYSPARIIHMSIVAPCLPTVLGSISRSRLKKKLPVFSPDQNASTSSKAAWALLSITAVFTLMGCPALYCAHARRAKVLFASTFAWGE